MRQSWYNFAGQDLKPKPAEYDEREILAQPRCSVQTCPSPDILSMKLKSKELFS
jgi:hypothetical protein